MRWPVLKCPYCGAVLPNRELSTTRPNIVCPLCCRQLQYATWYSHLSGLIALVLTITLCLFLGLSGFWLFGATVLLWFPVLVLWAFIFARISATRFEAYAPPKKVQHKSSLSLIDLSGRQGDDDKTNE